MLRFSPPSWRVCMTACVLAELPIKRFVVEALLVFLFRLRIACFALLTINLSWCYSKTRPLTRHTRFSYLGVRRGLTGQNRFPSVRTRTLSLKAELNRLKHFGSWSKKCTDGCLLPSGSYRKVHHTWYSDDYLHFIDRVSRMPHFCGKARSPQASDRGARSASPDYYVSRDGEAEWDLAVVNAADEPLD